jgi:hypothetical protein
MCAFWGGGGVVCLFLLCVCDGWWRWLAVGYIGIQGAACVRVGELTVPHTPASPPLHPPTQTHTHTLSHTLSLSPTHTYVRTFNHDTLTYTHTPAPPPSTPTIDPRPLNHTPKHSSSNNTNAPPASPSSVSPIIKLAAPHASSTTSRPRNTSPRASASVLPCCAEFLRVWLE